MKFSEVESLLKATLAENAELPAEYVNKPKYQAIVDVQARPRSPQLCAVKACPPVRLLNECVSLLLCPTTWHPLLTGMQVCKNITKHMTDEGSPTKPYELTICSSSSACRAANNACLAWMKQQQEKGLARLFSKDLVAPLLSAVPATPRVITTPAKPKISNKRRSSVHPTAITTTCCYSINYDKPKVLYQIVMQKLRCLHAIHT